MTNAFIRKTKSITGVTLTVIDTPIIGGTTPGVVPPNHTWTAVGLTIANTYSTAIQVNVVLNDNATNTYLVKSADIPVGGTLVVIGGDQKVVMINNGVQTDSIKVSTNNAAHTCDCILSILDSY